MIPEVIKKIIKLFTWKSSSFIWKQLWYPNIFNISRIWELISLIFFILCVTCLVDLHPVLNGNIEKEIKHAVPHHTTDNIMIDLHQTLNQYSMAIIVQPTNPLNYNSIHLTSSPFYPKDCNDRSNGLAKILLHFIYNIPLIYFFCSIKISSKLFVEKCEEILSHRLLACLHIFLGILRRQGPD